MNDILTRSITGALFVSAVVGSLYFSPLSTAILFSIVVLIALIEFNRLFSGHEIFSVSWETYSLGSLLTFGILLGVISGFLPPLVLAVIMPIWFTVFLLELFRKKAHPIANMAAFAFQNMYIVVPFTLLILLRYQVASDVALVIGMFVLIWANDTFAYLTGRLFGKTRLLERISPKKTWEGTLGGALMTFGFALSYGLIFGQPGFISGDLLFWIVAALIIVPTAVLGDLLESLMKRSLHIKDTGSILPGHGGILDRFDAAIFTIPFFYCWCLIYMYF